MLSKLNMKKCLNSEIYRENQMFLSLFYGEINYNLLRLSPFLLEIFTGRQTYIQGDSCRSLKFIGFFCMQELVFDFH